MCRRFTRTSSARTCKRSTSTSCLRLEASSKHGRARPRSTRVSPGLYGPYEQLQPVNWPLINGNEQLGEAYRRCCTSVSWVGEALTIHLLHAESVWNSPAFFDYVDR